MSSGAIAGLVENGMGELVGHCQLERVCSPLDELAFTGLADGDPAGLHVEGCFRRSQAWPVEHERGQFFSREAKMRG